MSENNPQAADWQSQAFRILNDGFVRVVDVMGDDASVVQAARISYGAGTKKLHEDRGLIRYLMRHRHSTPFEMCEIKLHVRVPMDCWRQWIRHRTANVNEYSTRYSEAIDVIQTTEVSEWRTQSTTNRQGSESHLSIVQGETLTNRERELHQLSRDVYRERLDSGVAREQARKDLPLATYTEAYWKIDLHNLLHFLSLRMDSHAQYEIRSYANVIGRQIVSKWVPITWEAFEDYRLNSVTFSRCELQLLKHINQDAASGAIAEAIEMGWLDEGGNPLRAHRERVEFESKVERIGVKVPWIQLKDS
jgi:thymidylate synthase (FAD)